MAYAEHYGNDEWFDFCNATELERFAAQLEHILTRKWIVHMRRVYTPDKTKDIIDCHEKVEFRGNHFHFSLHCNFGSWQKTKNSPSWISSELLPRRLDLTTTISSMQGIPTWFGPRSYLLLELQQQADQDTNAPESSGSALRTSLMSALTMATSTCDYALPAFLKMAGDCESVTGLFHPGFSAITGPRLLQFRAGAKQMDVPSPSLLVHDALNLFRVKLGGHPDEELGADVEVSMTWGITSSSSLLVNDSVMNVPSLEKVSAPLTRVLVSARWPSLHTHSTRDRALLLHGDLLKVTRDLLFMQDKRKLADDEQPTWSVGCEWHNPVRSQLTRALSALARRYRASKAAALQHTSSGDESSEDPAAPEASASDSDSESQSDSGEDEPAYRRRLHQRTAAGRAAAAFGTCICAYDICTYVCTF